MKVKNWEKFQHFKDRRPVWIKLYRELLDDYDINMLAPESFKFLIQIWLIASEDTKLEGNLPPVETIAYRLRLNKNKVLSLLRTIDIFLIFDGYKDDEDAMALTRSREKETEKETEKRISPPAAPVPPAVAGKKSEILSVDDLTAEGVPPTLAGDWLRVRKAKRAPLTSTAWAAVKREAAKARIGVADAVRIATERGWQSFKAEWYDGLPEKTQESNLCSRPGCQNPWVVRNNRNPLCSTHHSQKFLENPDASGRAPPANLAGVVASSFGALK